MSYPGGYDTPHRLILLGLYLVIRTSGDPQNGSHHRPQVAAGAINPGFVPAAKRTPDSSRI